MIAPMKKAILVLRERDKSSALKTLRRVGVIHADPIAGRGESWEKASTEKNQIEQAIGILLSYKTKEEAAALNYADALALARNVLETADTMKTNQEKLTSLRKEMERVRAWGDFDPRQLEYVRGKGMDIRLYQATSKAAAKLPSELPILRLVGGKNAVRFALFAPPVENLPDGVEEFVPPASSLSDMKAQEAALMSQNQEMDARLGEAVKSSSSLRSALKRAEADFTFETLLTGMEGEGPVVWLGGWVPEKDALRLTEVAAKNSWGLLLDDPTDEEQPPTKVENNAFFRMIAPVFDFLGTVPNYREYDISASFLVFFTIFFAMIFGDGGYGTILLLIGLFSALKAKKSSGTVPDFVRLLILMSAATVVWGAITGSWFGLGPEILPSFLLNLRIPWLSNANPMSGANTKQLCFILGVIHLVWAHLKNIKRDIHSLKFLAQIGLLLQLLGMYSLVLNLVLDAVRFPVPQYALILIGVGFVLNFVFANYEGSILKSILASLVNIVSVFLGVVNVFADITSYIRLWAVGLAGVAISQTVNSMAGPMLGKAILFGFGLILVIFGHGLNIILCVLSVIVHGVRLNMLEYSTHLGMEWSGFKYEPFREVAITTEEATV